MQEDGYVNSFDYNNYFTMYSKTFNKHNKNFLIKKFKSSYFKNKYIVILYIKFHYFLIILLNEVGSTYIEYVEKHFLH